ncbi:acyltransferase family protein [Paenibacillus sp. G2S3]|uniref:acyltransferase family protein n=1 Tax=Paenibacillus sp. G2S3 TaxID=3047872 RepID=UPI0024C1FDC6|nr:acyltransferase family protein [Paenibacillus sp. G2S3]WHY20506.1 acyltransferase family protein [Paenibacillus sp. G2S3]
MKEIKVTQPTNTLDPDNSKTRRRYMPGIDGLRALSVIAVIAYHLDINWAPGGLIGVGIFFVLSGYLITDQIIQRWKQDRRFDLKDFWIRRARRLLPAMFVMLFVTAMWLLVFDRSRLAALQGDFISSTLYFNNWWLIFHDVSYFESFGPPSPIGHLWSLAIEEQFYFIWPLVIIVGLRLAPQRGKLIVMCLTGAFLSALAMALIYQPGVDPSRVYYGTDTRAFALLIGAALALAWPSQNLTDKISRRSRYILDFSGAIGLITLILMIWRTNEYGQFLYYGGLVLVSILSAIVIAVLAHPASRLAKIMGCKPLRWIGVRSYSIYIWHYPVIILTNPTVDTGGFDGFRVLFQLGVSLLLASLSWKYIEEPIRQGLLGKWCAQLSTRLRFKIRPLFIFIAVPLIILSISCSSNLDTKLSANSNTGTITNPVKNEHNVTLVPPQDVPTPVPAPVPVDPPKKPEPQPHLEEAGKGVTAIGDSVILDAAPYLQELLPGIVIDGKVGRQMSQAQEVVDKLRAKGKLGTRVIINLGTNGAFNSNQLRKLLTSLEDVQQVVLVNTRVPKKWQNTVNASLKKVALEFPYAMVVDWHSSSEGKDSYFYEDGVHLKREGAKSYAALVAKAVQKENQ